MIDIIKLYTQASIPSARGISAPIAPRDVFD